MVIFGVVWKGNGGLCSAETEWYCLQPWHCHALDIKGPAKLGSEVRCLLNLALWRNHSKPTHRERQSTKVISQIASFLHVLITHEQNFVFEFFAFTTTLIQAPSLTPNVAGLCAQIRPKMLFQLSTVSPNPIILPCSSEEVNILNDQVEASFDVSPFADRPPHLSKEGAQTIGKRSA